MKKLWWMLILVVLLLAACGTNATPTIGQTVATAQPTAAPTLNAPAPTAMPGKVDAAKLVKVNMTASSNLIVSGDPFTVTWTTANAAWCSKYGAWEGDAGLNGSDTRVFTTTTEIALQYGVMCGNSDNTSSQSYGLSVYVVPTTTVPAPAATITETVDLTNTTGISMTPPLTVTTVGTWEVSYYDGVTAQMIGWGNALKTLVTDWSKFPNEDFPKYSFKARDGLEYGMAESAYCQRASTCDVNVPSMHYRLITGDYRFPGLDECTAKDGYGCGIAFFNVGKVTAMFREIMIDYGFTVDGRYWNGDAMATTIYALGSNTAYNMLNVGNTILGGVSLPVNPGANCSVSWGCKGIRFAVVITSGNQVLAVFHTQVTK